MRTIRANNLTNGGIKGNGNIIEDIILKTCSLDMYSEEEVPNRLRKGQFFYNTSRKTIGIYNGSKICYVSNEISILESSDLSLASEDEAGLIKLSDQFYLNEEGQLMVNVSALGITFEDVNVGRELISNVDVGGIAINDEFTSDQTLLDFVTALLDARVMPVYTSPTLTLTWSEDSSYEIGEQVTGTITANFTQNDAGSITSCVITLDGVQVNSDDDLSAEVTVVVGESNVFECTVSYDQGAYLTDNLGYTYSTGYIEAGSLTATYTMTGYRKSFAICNPDEITNISSEEIREWEYSFNDVQIGSSCEVPIEQGTKFIAFAHPADLGVCTCCIQKNSGVNVILSFDYTTIMVYGVDGVDAIDYFLYTYTSLKPLKQDSFCFKFNE